MIGERLKNIYYREIYTARAKKQFSHERWKRRIEHFNEITKVKHGEGSKIFELERTKEGDTRIRKVRL